MIAHTQEQHCHRQPVLQQCRMPQQMPQWTHRINEECTSAHLVLGLIQQWEHLLRTRATL